MNHRLSPFNQLAEQVTAVLVRREEEFEHTIPKEERAFLVEHVTITALDTINKYLDGSKRHGGNFLTDVPHMEELYKEILDLPIYFRAAMRARNKHDERYKGGKKQ